MPGFALSDFDEGIDDVSEHVEGFIDAATFLESETNDLCWFLPLGSGEIDEIKPGLLHQDQSIAFLLVEIFRGEEGEKFYFITLFFFWFLKI